MVDHYPPYVPTATEVVAVGSRVTAPNPRPDADYDWLALVPDIGAIEARMASNGFDAETRLTYDSTEEEAAFASFRRGDLNVIVTEDRTFFDKFLNATSLATALRLDTKEDRVTLFRAVLYDEFPVRDATLTHDGTHPSKMLVARPDPMTELFGGAIQ